MITLIKSILSLFSTLRIPTLLGLSIIFFGTAAGIVLVSREQLLSTQASLDPKPLEQPLLTNIQDQSVTISWKTSDPTTGIITYGQSSANESTALDDRDITDLTGTKTQARIDHYVTIKKLTPQTKYLYQIKSGKTVFPEIYEFTTASSSMNASTLTPVIGSVIYNDQPLTTGIAYLKIANGVTQSSLLSPLGSFTIPLSKVYKNDDLTEILPLTETTIGELTVTSQYGVSTATLFLSRIERPIGPLKIGDNLDLTFLPQIEAPKEETPDNELLKFDFNGDGIVNSADESVVKKNFGKSPKDPRANIDGIGDVDQADLDLIRAKIRDTNAGK